MYYIINSDKKIIATDSKFLNFTKVKNLQELFLGIVNHTIIINEIDDDSLEIDLNGEKKNCIQNIT